MDSEFSNLLVSSSQVIEFAHEPKNQTYQFRLTKCLGLGIILLLEAE